MKHLSQLALGVALCAIVTSAISFGAAFTGGLVANGGGVVEPTTGNFVTVGFEAEEQADGSITGEGVLQNHTTGITISYELNETLTVGGATYLAGPVTGGNGPPVVSWRSSPSKTAANPMPVQTSTRTSSRFHRCSSPISTPSSGPPIRPSPEASRPSSSFRW
ncbi:MAG: hypothetical protein ACJAQ3_002014 [Planctomycetota bacterium]|jgi:hypothetical protein